ncbi:N-acetylmuramoyl-L-alanine amidase [Parasphingorhabdus cellanae]|uniref:N-acetylmuramoyl-L-alanine amidase n=1 Tax=Parasphingorhabdus cellanae TaxID=2806553 RepID=A0ABX7T9E8_9SPHN|nr:N-acetylmuramoyl-L-alanine amidase [Parasphingorhabdus cellanae]QTD57663.1 N-acetylmuramoyl-L-alanine amidase [Parasphingorhabdus cellanae]
MIWTPSPNFDERKLPISILVMHYTGMKDAASAINWLANPDAKVSAHYVVTEDGQVVNMVKEEKRAWHAGRGYWRGIEDVNSASIGIEIVNPGHEWGYVSFPEEQMDAVTRLAHDIVKRHDIVPSNVIGHSDLAPARKQDPGELFDWDRLARHGIALKKPSLNRGEPPWTDSGFMLALERFGYDITTEKDAVVAFQRRFRPKNIDGVIDGECRTLLLSLMLDRERGITK